MALVLIHTRIPGNSNEVARICVGCDGKFPYACNNLI